MWVSKITEKDLTDEIIDRLLFEGLEDTVVEVAGRDDFALVTSVMKEKDFAAKYEALGDKVLNRIRVEA